MRVAMADEILQRVSGQRQAQRARAQRQTRATGGVFGQQMEMRVRAEAQSRSKDEMVASSRRAAQEVRSLWLEPRSCGSPATSGHRVI